MKYDPATNTPVTDAQTLVRVTYVDRADEGVEESIPLAADSYLLKDVRKALGILRGDASGLRITAIEVLRWPASAVNNPWTDVLPAGDDVATELAVSLFGNSGSRLLRWSDEKSSGYRLHWARTGGRSGPVEFWVTSGTGPGSTVAKGMDLAQSKIWIQEQGLQL